MSLTTGRSATTMPTDQEISSSLFRQLHQTTQPLSVLQGLLELALIESHTVGEYKHSVELALDELARVSQCFEELRRLIDLYRGGAGGHQRTGANLV